MSDLAMDISYIHMSSQGNTGEPDVAVALVQEEENIEVETRHRRTPWRALLDLESDQLISFACGIMALVIIGLSIVLGFSLITVSTQKSQLHDTNIQVNNLNTRINQMQAQIEALERK